MNVGIFYNSISNPAKFSNKTQLMNLFATGVRAAGDIANEIKQPRQIVTNIDSAFVLGYTLENNFRRQIIDTLKLHNIPTVFVDSNILHYARPEHQWHRYSLNGVYPTDGVYFFSSINLDKWNTYSQYHDVELKPWRTNGNHILILCQRPHGWNMFGNSQDAWLDKTIFKIRKIEPNRPIRIRMHPGDGSKQKQIDRIEKHYSVKTDRIELSSAANIREDLVDCWCTVGYNSTPNVVARIEGIPGYIEDGQHSWASDVSFYNLAQIVDPPMPDRSAWIHKIANIHWSNHEIASGQLWKSIRSYIEHSH